MFAAHALHRHPEHRAALAADDGPGFGWAFAQEVRRWRCAVGGAPFLFVRPLRGGLAAERLEWAGRTIAPDTMALLDLYGLAHDPDLGPELYRFDPSRSAYEVPEQDLRSPLERIPTAPRSGFVVSGFAAPPDYRRAENQHPA